MKRESKKWLGKKVKVIIDRPIGSIHPDFPQAIYELNYGYIPGTMAGDGEAIDAYVLGIDNPINEYDGVVVAFVERDDDNEFKLVVAQHKYSIKEIKSMIDFQEKYFKSKTII
ncbi:MAG: inorganic diphosphatase [Patescibacteria group bacterium]